MKDVIVCLVGESGSGKTAIAKALEKGGYNVIQSYTTRPPRTPDEWGHTFTDRDAYEKADRDLMIAWTEFNGNAYWTTQEQYRGRGISIYIVDPFGVGELRSLGLRDTEIVVIYLKVDELIRINRMLLTRPRDQTLERVHHDRDAFRYLRADYVIDNNMGIYQTLELLQIILQSLKDGGPA